MDSNGNREDIASSMLTIFGDDWIASPGWGWIHHKDHPHISIQYNGHSGDFTAHAQRNNNSEWRAKSKDPHAVLSRLVDTIQKDFDDQQYILGQIRGLIAKGKKTKKPKKHKCKDHWYWEQIGGIRVFREIGKLKVHRVFCGVCGKAEEVDSAGNTVCLE